MNRPKLHASFMPALIALLLIANFTFMLVAPSLMEGYKAPGDALTQTLVNLVILAVGFYLGSSSGSARKDETNAALTAQLTTPQAIGAGPTGMPDDPVTVTEVKGTP